MSTPVHGPRSIDRSVIDRSSPVAPGAAGLAPTPPRLRRRLLVVPMRPFYATAPRSAAAVLRGAPTSFQLAQGKARPPKVVPWGPLNHCLPARWSHIVFVRPRAHSREQAITYPPSHAPFRPCGFLWKTASMRRDAFRPLFAFASPSPSTRAPLPLYPRAGVRRCGRVRRLFVLFTSVKGYQRAGTC